MTIQETAKVVYVIRATYPAHFSKYTTKDYDNMIQAWTAVMEDYTYQQVSSGLKTYLASDTKGFPPSPGQVIDCIKRVTKIADPEMNALQAWGMVRKALSNSAYNADVEFAKLPEIVQKAVGSAANLHEMCQLPIEQVETVEQSQFIRTYNAMIKRAQEEEKIPSKVKALIEQAMHEQSIQEQKKLIEEGNT